MIPISIITFYLENGISVFRFDAVAFLWKKIGTGCVNLPETHEIVRLFRTILDYLAPSAILVTETNTPARENVTYFGNANEAHWIYNFSLPPLLIYSFLFENSKYLNKWSKKLPYLNLLFLKVALKLEIYLVIWSHEKKEPDQSNS